MSSIVPVRFVCSGPPVPWHRPPDRRGGGRRKHSEDEWYQQHIRVIVSAHIMGHCQRHLFPLKDECTVLMRFNVPDKLRRDVDNLQKNILDGLKNAAYQDDTQVHAVAATKCVEREQPEVEVVIAAEFIDVFDVCVRHLEQQAQARRP